MLGEAARDISESLERLRFGFIVIKAYVFSMKIDVLGVHELFLGPHKSMADIDK